MSFLICSVLARLRAAALSCNSKAWANNSGFTMAALDGGKPPAIRDGETLVGRRVDVTVKEVCQTTNQNLLESIDWAIAKLQDMPGRNRVVWLTSFQALQARSEGIPDPYSAWNNRPLKLVKPADDTYFQLVLQKLRSSAVPFNMV